MSIIKGKIKLLIQLPDEKYEYLNKHKTEVTCNTEFRPNEGTIHFVIRIPDKTFNLIKDSIPKFFVENKDLVQKDSWGKYPKPFSKNIRHNVLGRAVKSYEDVINAAIQQSRALIAETVKYIAIKFVQSNLNKRDSWNHANMGSNTSAQFQWFNVYKELNPRGMTVFSNRLYKVRKEDPRSASDIWAYIGQDLIEAKFVLIDWTKEREDYLTTVQSNYVKMNEKLESFLGNIDDKKIESLMVQGSKLFLDK